jgi:hypothetical protein
MRDKNPIVLAASAAVLALALGQTALAGPGGDGSQAAAPTGVRQNQSSGTSSSQPTAVQESSGATAGSSGPAAGQPAKEQVPSSPRQSASAQTPSGGQSASGGSNQTQESASSSAHAKHAATKKHMEEKHAQMMQERRRRYEELRQQAAQVGVDLPATPPWEQSEAEGPEQMGAPWTSMSSEERQKEWKQIRKKAVQELEAMREKHWQDLRERAKEQGIELPETPPWKAAEERRQAMRKKWEEYRNVVNNMSQEQKEAAQAVFGSAGRSLPPPPGPMGGEMPMEAPYSMGYGGPGFGPGAMPEGMMPGYGGQAFGPPMSEGVPYAPWFGSDKSSRQGPPPPPASSGPPQ